MTVILRANFYIHSYRHFIPRAVVVVVVGGRGETPLSSYDLFPPPPSCSIPSRFEAAAACVVELLGREITGEKQRREAVLTRILY